MKSKLMTEKEIKRLGIKHEQELVKVFKDNDFTACRLPGSASRSPDIIAGDGESIFVLEVKTTTSSLIKIKKQQIFTLRNFATNLKAKPLLALKFLNRSQWIFVKPKFLKIHEKSFSIDYNTAALNGFDIHRLISNELQLRLM